MVEGRAAIACGERGVSAVGETPMTLPGHREETLLTNFDDLESPVGLRKGACETVGWIGRIEQPEPGRYPRCLAFPPTPG